MYKSIVVILGVIFLVGAWFLASPLFIDETVDEDFRTTNGPALVVYLAKHVSPTKAGHVKDGGYLSLGKLKGNVGNQNYVVPPGTDITEFNSVVIWCELFGVLFSPAALTQS